MRKHIYVITTTTHFDGDSERIEFKISQKAYDTIEKAQKFCESRENVFQIDDFNYCSEPNSFDGWYEYQILELTLV